MALLFRLQSYAFLIIWTIIRIRIFFAKINVPYAKVMRLAVISDFKNRLALSWNLLGDSLV